MTRGHLSGLLCVLIAEALLAACWGTASSASPTTSLSTSRAPPAMAIVANDVAHSPRCGTRPAGQGPDYTYDETHYLADDGDHPNAAGHQQIATAAVDVIESALKP